MEMETKIMTKKKEKKEEEKRKKEKKKKKKGVLWMKKKGTDMKEKITVHTPLGFNAKELDLRIIKRFN